MPNTGMNKDPNNGWSNWSDVTRLGRGFTDGHPLGDSWASSRWPNRALSLCKLAVLQYRHVCSAIAHSFLLIEQPKSSWMLQLPEMAHLIQHDFKKYLTYIGYWGTGQQQAGRSPDLRRACRNPQRDDLGQPWLGGYHNKQPLGLRCLKDGSWLYRLYPINPMWHDGGT